MPDAPDQERYWSGNLDAQNLGRPGGAAIGALADELRFYPQPDQLAMFAHLKPGPGRVVLDLGCGLGVFTALLAETGADVVAADISQERLVEMRRQMAALPARAGRVWPVRARAEALPFRNDSLDGVMTKAVLIHTELAKAVAESARVLKVGGQAAFSEPMSRNPLANLYRRTLAPAEWKAIARYFGPGELDTVGRHFNRMQLEYFYLAGFAAYAWQYGLRSPRLLRLSLRVLRIIDDTLVRFLPRLTDRAWFVVIKGTK